MNSLIDSALVASISSPQICGGVNVRVGDKARAGWRRPRRTNAASSHNAGSASTHVAVVVVFEEGGRHDLAGVCADDETELELVVQIADRVQQPVDEEVLMIRRVRSLFLVD